MRRRPAHTDKIVIRLTPEVKSLLQQAAESRHKSVSEFVLDSAIDAAESVLKERNVIHLDSEHWEAFLAVLDAPPRRHPRLERLLQEPSVFAQVHSDQ